MQLFRFLLKQNLFRKLNEQALAFQPILESPEASETLIIRDVQGKPAYELSLFAISLNNQTTHSINISLSTTGRYSPDAEEKYESNLLNPDYWGHGDFSFRPEQLCAANRNNPLFGARRKYVLRRMRIIATVSGLELNDEGIVKMRIIVTVEPSASRRKQTKRCGLGREKRLRQLCL